MKRTSEPASLRRGKEFHKKVQDHWEQTASGNQEREYTIDLTLVPSKSEHFRKGRMDIFIPQVDDYVSIVEIKGTNWDRIKPANITRNLGVHRRQVWKYVYEYTDVEKIRVCAGVIYPKSPDAVGLKERVEVYMGEYGIAVVWFED